MRVIFKYIKVLTATIAGFMVACLLAAPTQAQYGQNVYGTCSFNQACDTTSTTTTPAGLDVAINLVQNQRLPLGTYIIEVTPLNGQGESFNRVEFYLNNQLLTTFTPDTTGTARYPWDTTKYKGTLAAFRIYDHNGGSIEKSFTVSIEATLNVTPVASSPAQAGFLEQTFQALPRPIAVSLPYLLYACLFIIMIILLRQSRREAKETAASRQALRRSQQLVAQKDGFIELVSHYLRTPLTLIRGGAELLQASSPRIAEKMNKPIQTFGMTIEKLIDDITEDQNLQHIDTPPKRHHYFLWLTPGVWVVVLAIGSLAAYLNYLLSNARIADISATSVVSQTAVFALLVVSIIVIMRNRHLNRRDHTIALQQRSQQIAIDEARNNLIRQAASDLSFKLEAIKTDIPTIPVEGPMQLLREGCDRAAQVLQRFRAIAQVSPPVTALPFTAFTLKQTIEQVERSLNTRLQAKHIVLRCSQDAPLASQQPAWVIQTLVGVVANAIAYSPEYSKIEVAFESAQGMGTIYVRDHGKGIPRSKLDQLLQPFSRAEAPTSFDNPGMGLSLYLGRLLMTSLGGDIRISSTLGAGTLVTLRFPTTSRLLSSQDM